MVGNKEKIFGTKEKRITRIRRTLKSMKIIKIIIKF